MFEAELDVVCCGAVVDGLFRVAGHWCGGREAMPRAEFAAYCDRLAAGEDAGADRFKITCPACGLTATRRVDRLHDQLNAMSTAGLSRLPLSKLVE